MKIKNWEELSKIPNESDTHVLVVNLKMGNGRLYAKEKRMYDDSIDYMDQIQYLNIYLSTHTFYELQYKQSTEILKACGFDVELESWG